MCGGGGDGLFSADVERGIRFGNTLLMLSGILLMRMLFQASVARRVRRSSSSHGSRCGRVRCENEVIVLTEMVDLNRLRSNLTA